MRFFETKRTMRNWLNAHRVWNTVLRGQIAACVGLSAIACSDHMVFWPSEEVELVAQSLPITRGTSDFSWELRWWDGAALRTRSVEWPTGTGFSLRVPADSAGAEAIVALVQGRHKYGHGQTLSIGGWARHPDIPLEMRVTHGTTAAWLLELADRGIDPGHLNLRRLSEAIQDEVSFPAEQIVDVPRLAEAFAGGEMRRSAVKSATRELADLSIETGSVSGTGDTTGVLLLTTDNPYEDPIVGHRLSDRIVWSVLVARGERRCFWHAASATEFVVWRDADGHALRAAYSLQ